MLNHARRREYLSEAFHSISQPLTALQCGLELAVAIPRNPKEYEKRIVDALQSAGCLREMVTALRELAEAEDLGEDAERIELAELFSALQDPVSKIAALHESDFEIRPPANIGVHASNAKMSKLILFLCDEASVSRGVLRLDAHCTETNVEITVECVGRQDEGARDQRSWSDRVREMRMSATDNYIATLGGVFHRTQCGFRILLAIAEN
jgi:signal transduction histidine kinase